MSSPLEIFVSKTDAEKATQKLVLARDGMGNIINRMRDIYDAGLLIADYDVIFIEGMPLGNIEFVDFVRTLSNSKFIEKDSKSPLGHNKTITVNHVGLKTSFFVKTARDGHHKVYYPATPREPAETFEVSQVFAPTPENLVEMTRYRAWSCKDVALLAWLMNMPVLSIQPPSVRVPHEHPSLIK